jgi:hypothetical protein
MMQKLEKKRQEEMTALLYCGQHDRMFSPPQHRRRDSPVYCTTVSIVVSGDFDGQNETFVSVRVYGTAGR